MTERQIFATYDSDGNYNGFYPTDVWDIEKIPTENRIEITYEQWQEAIVIRCKYVNGVHTTNPFTDVEQAQRDLITIRLKRNNLLSESDWTQFNDSPLSSEKRLEWATYRQLLRDITNSTPYTLPIKPE